MEIYLSLQEESLEQQQEKEEKTRLMLEQKLQTQQKQSEEDARWLRSKEENMVGVSK